MEKKTNINYPPSPLSQQHLHEVGVVIWYPYGGTKHWCLAGRWQCWDPTLVKFKILALSHYSINIARIN